MQGFAEEGQGLGFPGLPAPLDELHHGHLVAMAQGAQNQAQGGGGFALAIAGEDHHQALFQVPLADALLLNLLAPGHASLVAVLIGFRGQIPTRAKDLGGLVGGQQIARGDPGGSDVRQGGYGEGSW